MAVNCIDLTFLYSAPKLNFVPRKWSFHVDSRSFRPGNHSGYPRSGIIDLWTIPDKMDGLEPKWMIIQYKVDGCESQLVTKVKPSGHR